MPKKRSAFQKLSFVFLVCLQGVTFSQSTLRIDYNIENQTTDKPIPFDKKFNLVVKDIKASEVKEVFIFKTILHPISGERTLHVDTCTINAPGTSTPPPPRAIADAKLNFHSLGESLVISVPALLPEQNFDIHVVSRLSEDHLKLILNLNQELNRGGTTGTNTAAIAIHAKLEQDLFDKHHKDINRFAISYSDYGVLFTNSLSAEYRAIGTISTTLGISRDTLRAIAQAARGSMDSRLQPFVETCTANEWSAIQGGRLRLGVPFQSQQPAHLLDIITRIENLKINGHYVDTLKKICEQLMLGSVTTVTVRGGNFILFEFTNHLDVIRNNIKFNQNTYDTLLKRVRSVINSQVNIAQNISLSGNNATSDLKTKSGFRVFPDFGFASLVSSDVRQNPAYLPTLVYGLSIYFRDIDKNTRRSSLPKKPVAKNPCNPVRDSSVLSYRSPLQFFSLNIALTALPFKNPEFDHFLSKNSLLIGVGWRIYRVIKINGGIALIRRISDNPIISEKKLMPAGYVSVSVDLDFISGIKDFYQLLVK